MRLQLMLMVVFLAHGSEGRKTCKPPAFLKQVMSMVPLTNNVENKGGMQPLRVPGMQWADILSPAPKAIAYMTALSLITRDRDVSLEASKPSGGFKYVKWPKSLRATLDHIADSAYISLSTAHNNMKNIMYKTANGAEHFETIRNTVNKPLESADYKVFLPTALKRLSEVAPACVQMANETHEKFEHTVAYIVEVIEACETTQGINERSKQKAEQKRKVAAEMNAIYKKKIEEAKAKLAKREQLMEVAKKTVYEEIRKRPTAKDYAMVRGPLQPIAAQPQSEAKRSSGAGDFISAVGSQVLSILNPVKILKGIFSIFGRRKRSSSTSSTATTEEKSLIKKVTKLSVLHKMALSSYYEFPSSLIEDIKEEDTDVAVNIEKGVNHFKDAKSDIDEFIKDENPEGKLEVFAKKLRSIVDRALNLIRGIQTYKKNGGSLRRLTEKARKWTEDAIDFQTEFDGLTSNGGTLDRVVGPEEVYNTNGNYTPNSAVANLGMDYRMTLSATTAAMEAEKEIYMKVMTDLTNKQDVQMENLKTLMSIKFEELDLSQAIEILSDAIEQLSEIREQWQKLALFFSQLQIFVQNVYANRVIDFVDDYEKAASMSENFHVRHSSDLIFKQCFKTAVTNYRLHLLASTYTRISETHFLAPLQEMHRIAKISDLKDRKAANDEVQKKLGVAQEAIKTALWKEYTQTNDQLEKYASEAEKSLQVLCPTTQSKRLNRDVKKSRDKSPDAIKPEVDPFGDVEL